MQFVRKGSKGVYKGVKSMLDSCYGNRAPLWARAGVSGRVWSEEMVSEYNYLIFGLTEVMIRSGPVKTKLAVKLLSAFMSTEPVGHSAAFGPFQPLKEDPELAVAETVAVRPEL